MRKSFFLPRCGAFFLTLVLILPSPSFALRPLGVESAGVEENLQKALNPSLASGLEEGRVNVAIHRDWGHQERGAPAEISKDLAYSYEVPKGEKESNYQATLEVGKIVVLVAGNPGASAAVSNREVMMDVDTELEEDNDFKGFLLRYTYSAPPRALYMDAKPNEFGEQWLPILSEQINQKIAAAIEKARQTWEGRSIAVLVLVPHQGRQAVFMHRTGDDIQVFGLESKDKKLAEQRGPYSELALGDSLAVLSGFRPLLDGTQLQRLLSEVNKGSGAERVRALTTSARALSRGSADPTSHPLTAVWIELIPKDSRRFRSVPVAESSPHPTWKGPEVEFPAIHGPIILNPEPDPQKDAHQAGLEEISETEVQGVVDQWIAGNPQQQEAVFTRLYEVLVVPLLESAFYHRNETAPWNLGYRLFSKINEQEFRQRMLESLMGYAQARGQQNATISELEIFSDWVEEVAGAYTRTLRASSQRLETMRATIRGMERLHQAARERNVEAALFIHPSMAHLEHQWGYQLLFHREIIQSLREGRRFFDKVWKGFRGENVVRSEALRDQRDAAKANGDLHGEERYAQGVHLSSRVIEQMDQTKQAVHTEMGQLLRIGRALQREYRTYLQGPLPWASKLSYEDFIQQLEQTGVDPEQIEVVRGIARQVHREVWTAQALGGQVWVAPLPSHVNVYTHETLRTLLDVKFQKDLPPEVYRATGIVPLPLSPAQRYERPGVLLQDSLLESVANPLELPSIRLSSTEVGGLNAAAVIFWAFSGFQYDAHVQVLGLMIYQNAEGERRLAMFL